MTYFEWIKKLMRKYEYGVEDINNMPFISLYTFYDIDKKYGFSLFK